MLLLYLISGCLARWKKQGTIWNSEHWFPESSLTVPLCILRHMCWPWNAAELQRRFCWPWMASAFSILLICSVALKDTSPGFWKQTRCCLEFYHQAPCTRLSSLMESEPGWRYSIRVCVGCTTGHFWCKTAVQPLPCSCSRWVPTHPQCWLWHSLPGQRWRAMNEVITTQQFLNCLLVPAPVASPWPVNHTLHPGGCVDPLQKAQPSKGRQQTECVETTKKG